MERQVDLDKLTDGRRYGSGDMVRADSGGCVGCSACCRGMGDSILLDPLDAHRICACFGVPFEALMADHVALGVVDGMILPHLQMVGEDEHCIFLNAEGRCGIHKVRPGFCRLFPLGRLYENRDFRYIMQVDVCAKKNLGKVQVRKWLGEKNIAVYERFVKDWHYFLKDAGETLLEEGAGEDTRRNVNIYILKQFYLRGFEAEKDFYQQFNERLAESSAVIVKNH